MYNFLTFFLRLFLLLAYSLLCPCYALATIFRILFIFFTFSSRESNGEWYRRYSSPHGAEPP